MVCLRKYENPIPKTTMPKTQPQDDQPMILPHQTSQYERLCAIARVVFHFSSDQFPLAMRTNVLVIGPSGSGKTHIARAVATTLKVPVMYINVSEWILLGCSSRGAGITWPRIFEFLKGSSKSHGCLIVLDEMDKLYGTTDWSNFLRNEVFSLLDKKIPGTLTDADGDPIAVTAMDPVQEFLRKKVMIIGAGAFQHIWEERTKSTMGFGQEQTPHANPDLAQLSKTLPRELVNRFGSNLITLPHLQMIDYRNMLACIAERMPDFWRGRFERLASGRLGEALRLQQGPRFFEELLLEMVLAERLEIASFNPHEEQCKLNLEPEVDDIGIF